MDNINQKSTSFIPNSRSRLSDIVTEMYANLNMHRKNKSKSYKPHFLALLERCESIQQDNERLVNRIQQVAKQLRRTRVERKFIMDRLDKHGDNWREVDLQIDLGLNKLKGVDLKNRRTVENLNVKNKSVIKFTEKKDPTLPKRPANPFFKFCQEQRPIVLSKIIKSGESQPSKPELTKLLAITWNTMDKKDKEVYYDMYQKSKEKYSSDMQEYTLNKSINTVQTSKYLSSQ